MAPAVKSRHLSLVTRHCSVAPECGGAAMAERSDFWTTPLNLMRVMPTQGSGPSRTGGLVLSHAFSAHGFVCDENNQERRTSGKEFLFRSDSSVSCFPYSSF